MYFFSFKMIFSNTCDFFFITKQAYFYNKHSSFIYLILFYMIWYIMLLIKTMHYMDIYNVSHVIYYSTAKTCPCCLIIVNTIIIVCAI